MAEQAIQSPGLWSPHSILNIDIALHVVLICAFYSRFRNGMEVPCYFNSMGLTISTCD